MLQILGYHLVPDYYQPAVSLDTGFLDPLHPPTRTIRVDRTPIVTTVSQDRAKAAIVTPDDGAGCSNALYLVNKVLVPDFSSAGSFQEASEFVLAGRDPGALSRTIVPAGVDILQSGMGNTASG